MTGRLRTCDGVLFTSGQTVFGEGAPEAHLVLIGEQPGDVEDREGRPFVGHPLVATLHPSAVLRARSSGDRSDAFDRLVGDLRRAASIGR